MSDYAETRRLYASRARLRKIVLACLLAIQTVDETDRQPAIELLHTIMVADTELFDEFVETLRTKPVEAARSAEVLRDLLSVIEEHRETGQDYAEGR
jgi:phosphoenolpyruvate-protein kinase (PTS system EI component)